VILSAQGYQFGFFNIYHSPSISVGLYTTFLFKECCHCWLGMRTVRCLCGIHDLDLQQLFLSTFSELLL